VAAVAVPTTHSEASPRRGAQTKTVDKKTAVLLAPPKFREETSKKAARLSASAI